MDAAPVIARGHNVAVFVPPVTEAALPVIRAVTRRPVLILTADASRAVELADALPGAVAVTGLERARLRLSGGTPDVVACGVDAALALLTRSALHPAAFACVALAWPEQLDEDGVAALGSVMAECDKDAPRLVLTARAGTDTDGLIERYAFKAMTFGFKDQREGAPPEPPVGPARYVIGRADRLGDLRRAVLDALHPERDELIVVAPCPASRDDALALAARAVGGESPVIVADAHQIGWLRTLFAPLSPLHLSSSADVAEARAEKLRARIARTIETEDLDRELLTLGPLLGQFDPALVAAAAMRLAGHQDAAPGRAAPTGSGPQPAAMPTIAKIWIGIGRKDNVKPGDLVGAIVNEAGVPAEGIGKIDVRDLFCLVDVRAEFAEQVVRGLTGKSVRGRRLVARVDRGPGAGARPPRRA